MLRKHQITVMGLDQEGRDALATAEALLNSIHNGVNNNDGRASYIAPADFKRLTDLFADLDTLLDELIPLDEDAVEAIEEYNAEEE